MNILEVVYQICLNNIAVNFQYKKKSDYKIMLHHWRFKNLGKR